MFNGSRWHISSNGSAGIISFNGTVQLLIKKMSENWMTSPSGSAELKEGSRRNPLASWIQISGSRWVFLILRSMKRNG